MPRLLTEERLNRVQYTSMADYIRSVDALDNFEDKMAFTTRYLLAYGPNERDVSFAEAIHIAKVKIAEASAKMRKELIMVPDEAVNPHLSDEEDANNRLFMIDPLTYLQNENSRLLMQEANKNANEINETRLNDLNMMSMVLMNGQNSNLPTEISALDYESNSRDVKARLTARFGGRREFEQAYKAIKPGFFARMFKTSRAYINLEQAYDAFNNPDHVLYGNLNSLDKAATEYLQHCFPRWNPKTSDIGTGYINRLGGTKKARALFCYNILKANKEQRNMENVYENIISANNQIRVNKEAGIDDEFQQSVHNDIVHEEELDSSQAEREYHDVFKDAPEAEEDELVK